MNPDQKINTWSLRLAFLLAPEDSSAAPSDTAPWRSTRWHLAKTMIWIAFSVVTAILIGQL